MQLGEEGDEPHEVAADDGGKEGGSPQPREGSFSFDDPGVDRIKRRRGEHAHLVLTLGCQEPRRNAQGGDDDKADPDRVTVGGGGALA